MVGLVDNILMPYLYSRGASIHPLVILFAVLGGLATFGPLGFLIGPIVVSLFIAVFDIDTVGVEVDIEQAEADAAGFLPDQLLFFQSAVDSGA